MEALWFVKCSPNTWQCLCTFNGWPALFSQLYTVSQSLASYIASPISKEFATCSTKAQRGPRRVYHWNFVLQEALRFVVWCKWVFMRFLPCNHGTYATVLYCWILFRVARRTSQMHKYLNPPQFSISGISAPALQYIHVYRIVRAGGRLVGGRALAAQQPGVLGSIHSDSMPFHLLLSCFISKISYSNLKQAVLTKSYKQYSTLTTAIQSK